MNPHANDMKNIAQKVITASEELKKVLLDIETCAKNGGFYMHLNINVNIATYLKDVLQYNVEYNINDSTVSWK